MDFSSGSKLPGGGDMNVDAQIAEVKQRIFEEMLKKKLQKMTDKCFNKCITKPGSSLDNSQMKCLAFCMDRYGDAEQIIVQSLENRLSQGS